MKLTNDSYVILIKTKNATERYYRDKTGWLKLSSRRRMFRMTAEQVLNHVGPKCFVASFHVSQVQIGKHVREQCEKPVPNHVPEIENAVRMAAHETRSEHGVSCP